MKSLTILLCLAATFLLGGCGDICNCRTCKVCIIQ